MRRGEKIEDRKFGISKVCIKLVLFSFSIHPTRPPQKVKNLQTKKELIFQNEKIVQEFILLELSF